MNQWLRRLDLRWNRALLLQAALLLVPPVTAFYLMQFILGAYPWQMTLGVVAANAICIGAGLLPAVRPHRTLGHQLCTATYYQRDLGRGELLRLGLPGHPGAPLGSHRSGYRLRGLQQL